ncbi:SMP-30/gluconolactonase/LRE family protein [Rufibacter sp. XAAS-G3-1]|uniref:SMP-30/gluconolactonase/LRE family protein n=1 Tax=Rufibacter sp. XAAS-G3-1 TaxID=2729134 RepID=UPI0015E719BD|nr:L-dopachrome tautomerase-related protein [Rufibacter sp. XAAS-G3-1]
MATANLTNIATFKGAQITGVTISQTGRLFANFPRWHNDIPFSVVEVQANGQYRAYPDEAWNAWHGQPEPNTFTCVQSVVANGDSLFVLDPASPMMKGVVGNAMLYEFDLESNTLKNNWAFDKAIAPEKSYLNDLRIDREAGKIYITESGIGAIIVLDLETGVPRRLLDDHPSTKSEDVWLTVEGERWVKDGEKPSMHADGIALSNDRTYLYYHALTGYTLYRVPAAALNDTSLDAAALASQVENLGKTTAPDGMIFDRHGNLYLGDLEKNAIMCRTPDGELRTLVEGKEVKWPDTFTIDQHDNFYFTTSRIHEAVGDISGLDFHIFRVPLAESQS